jgi:hypothetical protein
MTPPEPSAGSAPPATQETPPEPVLVERPAYRWYQKVSAVLLVTFCLEIGLFLLIFPWTGYWDNNYFSLLTPEWRQYWINPYFRGAISGLGIGNLYISVGEVLRLRRFTKKQP